MAKLLSDELFVNYCFGLVVKGFWYNYFVDIFNLYYYQLGFMW